jgi:anti-sigma28 factor (negative regulator of flagellin synthesis)
MLKLFPMWMELGMSGTLSIEDCVRSLCHRGDDARLEKINNLRQALADKTYNISAEDLTQKLIDYMLLL